MQCMARYLIDIGRELRESQELDVADHLLCENTIRKSIQQVRKQER